MNPVSIVSLNTFSSHFTVKPKNIVFTKITAEHYRFPCIKTLTDHREGERKKCSIFLTLQYLYWSSLYWENNIHGNLEYVRQLWCTTLVPTNMVDETFCEKKTDFTTKLMRFHFGNISFKLLAAY